MDLGTAEAAVTTLGPIGLLLIIGAYIIANIRPNGQFIDMVERTNNDLVQHLEDRITSLELLVEKQAKNITALNMYKSEAEFYRKQYDTLLAENTRLKKDNESLMQRIKSLQDRIAQLEEQHAT